MKRLTTAEFAMRVGCKVSLLEGLRRGKNPKFSPTYREKNRCYYTDDQIPMFQEMFAPKDVVIVDDAAQVETPDTTGKQTRIAEATKFFNQLYGKIPASQFVYLAKSKGGFETFTSDALTSMAQKAVELSDSGVESIWHSVNPVRVAPHGGKRGSEDVVSYQTALVCDIDIQSAAHKSDNLVATFNEAKSLLPFAPSLIVNSGYGLQAYYIFDTPLAITEDNREEIKRRNKLLLDVIRSRANGKKIDGVGDLPRIMRTPSTFNHKCGKDNAPMCHVVEDTGLRYTPADIDERLNAFDVAITPPVKPARTLDINYDDTDTDLKEFRIHRMLDCINVVDGEYEKWLSVGFALYNEGFDCDTWIQWSRTQPNFNEGECESKWQGFRYESSGYAIGTLYQYATEGGYDEKEIQREYYQLHPEKSKRNLSGGSAQIDDPQKELTNINKRLAVFKDNKAKALKKFNDEILTLEIFDKKTLYADDIINAVAIARLYQPDGYTFLRSMISDARDENPDARTVNLTEFGGLTKRRAEKIKAQYDEWLARKNELQAAIKTQKFFAANQDDLDGCTMPKDYSISELGIWHFNGKTDELICHAPVVIAGKVFSIANDDLSSAGNKFKLALKYKTEKGKWRTIAAQDNSTVLNAHRLIELADAGIPVTSVNASALVSFFDAFKAENKSRLPMIYEVARCGWHEFHNTTVFIDPRRDCVIKTADDTKISVKVSDASEFAKHLVTKGDLKDWQRAYELAKKSPVARAVVAASVAAPLLDIVHERNFMLYIKARTRSGKTSALMLGAAAIGSEKIIRSFDSTKNGLIGAAADVNDFAFLIDEKQVADSRLKESLADLVYALANGVGRTKLNRDSTLKKLQDWRTIAIATGETDLLSENVTGGADTRLLTLHAPDVILPPADCRQIRDIVKNSYGHALPLVIDKIKAEKDNLRGWYNKIVDDFTENYKDVLPEHARYLSVISVGDAVLNCALGVDFKTALDDASENAYTLLDDLPTVKDISATDRAKDFVRSFVGENQNCFVGGAKALEHMTAFYGKLNDQDYIYITVKALKDACDRAGFDYRKLVADLIADGFFVPADTIKKGYKKPLATVQKKIGRLNADCYRVARATFDGKR